MFETGLLLLLKALLLNILIPLIPWMIFIFILFGAKYKWFILYFISWFIWVWVVSFGLFNLAFIHFWVSIIEYFIILAVLIVVFIWKILIYKQKLSEYTESLKINLNIYSDIWTDFQKQSRTTKGFIISLFIYSILFVLFSFFTTISFPSYSDDSFGNWNMPAVNILYDGWVKMTWPQTEILWRWRLGYPIYIPIYKALISSVFWWWNDIYIKLFQFLAFAIFCKFIFVATFEEKKDTLLSMIPVWLICWLPLMYFHIIDSYLDIPCWIYSILSIYYLYKYLQNSDFKDFSLWLLFWFILSYIKNDWFVVYLAWILIAFAIILFKSWRVKSFFQEFKKRDNIITTIFNTLFFFIPFFALKSYLNLGWNQAAGQQTWAWLTSMHSEIFWIFPEIFFNEDNFSLILIILWVMTYFYIKKKSYKDNSLNFLVLAFLMIFLILIAVFLFTENFLFALNQTTINRVFTVAFIIILSFSGLILKND